VALAVLLASAPLSVIRAAAITNSNPATVWTTNTNGWATVSSFPWSKVNGSNNTAVFTNTTATVTVTNTGVWLGGITFSNAAAATLTLGGGTLNFAGTASTLSLPTTNSLLSVGVPVLASNASGNTVTLAGSGTVSFTGTNKFQTVSVNSGTFQIASGNSTFLNDGMYYGNPAGLIRLSAGTLTCSNGSWHRNNWMISGGLLTSTTRFTLSSVAGQWMLMTGGTLQANGTFGLRIASDQGYGFTGGSAASLTNEGGTIQASSLTLGGFTTAGAGGTVTLSSGTMTVSGDVGLQSAANKASTNLLILSGGRFSCSGTLKGQTNAGALQAILWNGGVMAPSVVNMTNLSSSTNPYVNGTLSNGGGTFAPGDKASPGLATVYGNYAQGSGTLEIEAAGTTPATSFQHATGTYHDRLTVSGTATLGGALSVSLIRGYIPSGSDTLTVVTASGGISGFFTNVVSGGSLSVDGTNGFLVNTSGNTLQLSSYHRIGAPSITLQPLGLTNTVGGSATLTVTATSPISQSFQWFANSNPITGATNSNLILTNLQTSDSGSYAVTVSNADGSSSSVAASVLALRLATITSQPVSAMVPSGGSATFAVTATAPIAVSYQWQCNGTNVPGATDSVLTLSNVVTPASYAVVITTDDGSATSASVQLAVLSLPVQTITNSSLTGTWSQDSSGWSGSPVTNPWSASNGRYATALLTNSGSMGVDPSGITLSSLSYSASSLLALTGGSLILDGATNTITVDSSTGSLLLMGALTTASGGGAIVKSGPGLLQINGTSSFSGTLAVSSGNLLIGASGSLGSASLSFASGTSFTNFGIVGSVNLPMGRTNGTNSPGFYNSGIVLGQVVIPPPSDGPVYVFGGNRIAGNARFDTGTWITNVVVNGRLDLVGNGTMTVSGITGSNNGVYTGGPAGINGTGLVANYNTYASTNAFGGVGNILSFVSGATFSQFFKGPGSDATLVQSGTGTVSFATWGYNSTNTLSNTLYTFSGGNWNIGQIGQNNSAALDSGTNVITGGASVAILSQTRYAHGTWIVNQGQLGFNGLVSEEGGGTPGQFSPLQITVNRGGVLTNNGNYTIGLQTSASNPAGVTHQLVINGGFALLGGNLGIGTGQFSTTNDANLVILSSGTLSVRGLTLGYSGSATVTGLSNALTLSGGEILCSGSVSAGTNTGQSDLFVWSGGQLSASSINLSSSNWAGNISSGVLFNSNGVMAPGDTGIGGRTDITGSYVQGPGGILDVDLGGSAQASAFQSGTNTFDILSISGSAVLGGTLRIRIPSGFVPNSAQSFTVLSAVGGISGGWGNLFATNRVISEDGKGSFLLSTNGASLTLSQYMAVTPPVITLQPQGAVLPPGGSTFLSVEATGGDPSLSYQWYFNGVPMTGETNPLLFFRLVNASNSGAYAVTVSNSGSFSNSQTVSVGIAPAPAFLVQPLSGTLLAGGSTTLTASVQSDLPATLQWSFNGTPLSGATNSLLLLTNLAGTNSGSYVLTASNASGVTSSEPAILNIAPLAATGLSGGAFLTGGSTTLSVSAQSSTPATYQWRKNGATIAGATNASLIFSNLAVSDDAHYSVTLSNAAGSLTTPEVVLVVTRPYTNPTALFYPLNAQPVSGTGRVPDALGKTAGTIAYPSGSNAILPVLLTNQTGLPGGNAWSFTNTAAFVSVPPTASNAINRLGDITNTTGLSVSFWVNFFFPGRLADVINKRFCGVGFGNTIDVNTLNSGGPGQGILAFYFGNNVNIPQVALQTGNAPNPNNSAMIGALNGSWHHLVATLDFTSTSNNARLYMDGTLVDSASQVIPSSFNDVSATPVIIAGRGNSSLGQRGSMAMFGLYTKALVPGEVQQLASGTNIVNFAPVVFEESDSSLLEWPANQMGFQGIAVDDGQPAGSFLTYAWSMVSGPGSPLFLSATNPCTSVTFPVPGIYTLRLTASDGLISGSSDVVVNVAVNQPPVVYAGASSLNVEGGGTLNLTGGAVDDGLPVSSGGTLRYSWTQLSGPQGASLATPSSPNSAVTLPGTPGTHVFQLTVSDGVLVGSNRVTVNVVQSLPPVVTARAPSPMVDLSVTNGVSLLGSGSTTPSRNLSYAWSQVSGEGTATFTSRDSASTLASFSVPGTYRLRLTASDGNSSSSSDVWVRVWSSRKAGTVPVSRAPMSSNPAPYVHPRIFFTEADRPSLLAATTDTNNPVVTNAVAILRSNVAATIDNPSSLIGAAYQRMKSGDASYDIRPLVIQETPYVTWSGYTSSGFYGTLSAACYLAWVDNQNPALQQRLRDLATAVATAARQHTTWYLADRMLQSGSSNPAAFHPFSYDVYSSLALCYDMMYNWMSEEQRGVTRSLLAWMTAGRTTYGVGELDHLHSTNWRTFHSHLIAAQLAIEGETGFDSVSVIRNMNSFKVFTDNWGISEEGINREGPGYFNFGFRNAAPSAYALSRRYEDLFTTSRMYSSLNEFLYRLTPDASGRILGLNDGVGWSSDTTYFVILKAAFPDDPLADWLYRMNRLAHPGTVPLTCAIFGRPYLAGNTSFKAMAAAKSMPLFLFSPQRGVTEMRSDWSTNALTINVEARPDAFSLGHMHSIINSFSMEAMARDWFLGHGYHWTCNDFKQTVLIDSVGQAGTSRTLSTNNPAFATNFITKWPSMPGRTVEVVNHPGYALFAGDSAACYTYSWSSTAFGDLTGNPYKIANSILTPYQWRDNFYPGYVPAKPVFGDNSWMDAPIPADDRLYNPVSKAFRTLVMIRGSDPDVKTYPRPYMLVMDDIAKNYSNNIVASLTNSGIGLDTNTHTFIWSANTVSESTPANDVVTLASATTTNAVLYHSVDSNTLGRPQLSVQVVAANGDAAPITFDPTPLDKGDATVPANRLLITRSNTTSPDFKVILYPHLFGEPLPTTTYGQTVTNGVTNAIITVRVPTNSSGGTVTDLFTLRVQPDGRTRILSYARGGATPPVITVPQDITVTTGSNSAVVNFAVTARDSSNSPVVPSVNPPSGFSFPTGSSIVNVSACDASGNTAASSFRVTVNPVAPTLLPSVGQIGAVTVGAAGSVTYDTNSAVYSFIGRGGTLGTSDSCTEALMSWTDNGVFTARLATLSCADSNGIAFLNLRLSTNAGAPSVLLGVRASGQGLFQARSSTNGTPLQWSSNGVFVPEWLRLVRNGTNFSGFLSPDGTNWSRLGPVASSGIASNATVLVGLGAAPNTPGYSAYATFDQVSFLAVPPAPQSLTASNNVGSVGLLWTAVPGADGYLVQRSLASNGPFTNIASLPGSSFNDASAPVGQFAFYQVAATNGAGSGPFAGPVSGGMIPSAPSGVTSRASTNDIGLSWSSSGTGVAFSVKRSLNPGGPYELLATGLIGSSYSDPGVTFGKTYYYVVTSTNGVGESSPSAEVVATLLTPLQAWRQQLFGSAQNSGNAADSANPSGDGIPNLMKYALGLDPLGTNAAVSPLAVLTNGSLRMDFSRIADPDLTYSIEASGDLSLWTNVWTSTGASNLPGPVSFIDSNAPVSGTTRRFLRLRVTAPSTP
jgi:autotransporter-associated beta strand protein